MKLYLRVISYIKPYWKTVLAGILFTLLYIIFSSVSLWVAVDFVNELFVPEKTQAEQAPQPKSQADILTDRLGEQQQQLYEKINAVGKAILIQDNKFDTLKVVCFVIFLSFLLKNISLYLHRVIFHYVELKIVVQIRNDLQHRLMQLPLSFFHTRHSGKLTSVVFNDVNAIQKVLDSSFVKVFLAPMQIISYLVLLFIFSWKLTIITFILIPISGVLILKIGQSMRRRTRRMLEQVSLVVTAFQESVSAIRIVKAFTAEIKESEKFQFINNNYFKKAFRAKRLGQLTSPLNETIAVSVFAVLLWFGGTMVFRGEGMTAELFMRYLIFLFMLFQPLREFAGLNNVLQSGMAAAERIFNFLDTPTEPYTKANAVSITKFEDSIVFSDVFFFYDEEVNVLRNINLVINKGEMVAFVGHSGVGKSTLVDLIPRFYDVTSGSISIDGHDVRDLDLISLRDQIGMVTQETLLFNDSIRYNISYGGEGYSDEDIIAAAKSANAWEFIEQMEHGLDTIVGERGVTISGGQRQRLSIARAILKNTPILILDEATSALDSQSEKLVQNAIEKLMHNRTVLAIAHRLSTIMHADKIVVMDKGQIVDVGKHEELLKSSPVYLHLYKMQFQTDE
jgi:subfamily B ATP-binding cassette protein MsbA